MTWNKISWELVDNSPINWRKACTPNGSRTFRTMDVSPPRRFAPTLTLTLAWDIPIYIVSLARDFASKMAKKHICNNGQHFYTTWWSPTPVHIVTWSGVGFYMCATPRSWQGHLKVTARSSQLKMDENNLFLLFFLQLCPHKMSMMVQTNLEPNTFQYITGVL